MYKIFLFILGVIFVSCSSKHSSDDPEPAGRRIPVEFTVNGSISRTTMDASYNSSFSVSDQIGIFATGGANATNVKYTVTDGNKLTTSTNITTDGTANKCNFYAYHPYSDANGAGSVVSHAVNTDQSTERAFYASDFVTATATDQTITKGQPVKLAFKHRMALIEMTVTMPEGEDMPIGARITNCLNQGQWDYATDQFTASAGTASVTMLSTGQGTGVFRAIVPEQTIPQGTPLFVIEAPMATYTFTTQQDVEIKSNYVKKFKVGINAPVEDEDPDEFSAEVSISSWQVDDDVVTGQGVEKTANYIVREDFDGDVQIKRGDFYYKSQFPTAEGWYFGASTSNANNTNTGTKIMDDPFGKLNSKVVELTKISSSDTWYYGMLTYVVFKPTPGKYRMRAKITSDAESIATDFLPKKQNFTYYMTAVMIKTEEAAGSVEPNSIGYFASGTSPDGSMVTEKYGVPSVDTYYFNREYKVITADIDLTQAYRCTNQKVSGLSSTPTTPTEEMYDMVLFAIGGDILANETVYIDSFTVELLENE